jgi:hypothetical protein
MGQHFLRLSPVVRCRFELSDPLEPHFRGVTAVDGGVTGQIETDAIEDLHGNAFRTGRPVTPVHQESGRSR